MSYHISYKIVGRKVIAKLLAKSYLISVFVRKHVGSREDLHVDGSTLTF
jgi:hypothetical protein